MNKPTINALATIPTYDGKKWRICKVHAGQGAKIQDSPAKSRTVGKYTSNYDTAKCEQYLLSKA